MSFSDKVRRRCSVLQWNPDYGIQLIVASDEDGSPPLKVWDMRYTVAPVNEFSGHSKGVIAMSWCPHGSYLLTCAKDFQTICCHTNSGEIVCELPAGTSWNYEVHWYANKPGVISASSFDGKISIYNIEEQRLLHPVWRCPTSIACCKVVIKPFMIVAWLKDNPRKGVGVNNTRIQKNQFDWIEILLRQL